MRRILYMIRKEFIQVFRDPHMVAILFMVPLIQMLILGFALTSEVKHVRLIVCDQDNTAISREIWRAFFHTDRFDVVGFEQDVNRIGEDIQAWKAQMALVIPSHFARDIRKGKSPQIQLLVDGLDGNTAAVALGYARGILTGLSWDFFSNTANRQLLSNIHLVQMNERMWYNLNLSHPQYMIPGIVVVLLTLIPMMLSAMSLVREKEIGTLEQLMVTPLKKHQLLLGKIIPFLILSFVELAVVMKVAQWIFSVEMSGSYVLLAVLSVLYLFTTLGLGIFISTITTSQQQAMFVSWFFMVFMILMSGFFIPIENMPELLRQATYLNPMRYFMYIIRDIFQKGSSALYLYRDALPMTLMGVTIFSFSIIKFHKRLG